MALLRYLVNSIAFHVAKYRRCGNGMQMGRTLYDGLQSTYRNAWKKYCLNLFQAETAPPSAQEGIYAALWRYYSLQQRHRVKYRFGYSVAESAHASDGWLYPAITNLDYSSGPETETLSAVDKLLRTNFSCHQRAIAWHTAARLLRPRENLERRKLLTEIAELTLHSGKPSAPNLIKDYIEKAVDRGRRHWPSLPKGYAVLGHVTREGSSALLVSSPRNGVWIEGIIGQQGVLYFFDERLTEDEGRALGIQNRGRYWSTVVGAEKQHGTLSLAVLGRRIRLPHMTVSYRPPAQKWLS
jgi:hypothetical protein